MGERILVVIQSVTYSTLCCPVFEISPYYKVRSWKDVL